jgi:hypothetical protein
MKKVNGGNAATIKGGSSGYFGTRSKVPSRHKILIVTSILFLLMVSSSSSLRNVGVSTGMIIVLVAAVIILLIFLSNSNTNNNNDTTTLLQSKSVFAQLEEQGVGAILAAIQPQLSIAQTTTGNASTTFGGNATTEPQAFLTYENPTYGIFMQYPSNWTASTSGLPDYTDVIAFYSPPQNVSDLFPARLKISVVQYSQDISLPEYKNFTLSTLNQSRQFTLINSSDVTVAGYPGYRIVLTNKPFPNDTLILHSMNIATAIENKIYLITYDGQELAFNKHLPEVGRMLESMMISGGR